MGEPRTRLEVDGEVVLMRRKLLIGAAIVPALLSASRP